MEANDDAIDLISNLPDIILTRILSFLTTREAVHTCTLSKRWSHVWAVVPVLNIDTNEFLPKDIYDCDDMIDWCDDNTRLEFQSKFGSFVHGVLENRNKLELVTFRLRHKDMYAGTIVSRNLVECLLYVVECQPRAIFIEMDNSERSNSFFPDAIWTRVFNCTSLRKMDLVFECNYYSFEVIRPESINLPSLKALTLRQVTNLYDDSFVKMLCTGCPVLEELVLIWCEFLRCEVASNRLKKLVIDGFHFDKGIQISCPNLVSLVITFLSTPKITLENLPSLVEAEISGVQINNLCSSGMTTKLKLLGGLSSATNLCLHFSLYEVKDLLSEDISNCKTFCNLESLELGGCFSNEGFDVVACFVHNSPNLQKLTLHLTEQDEGGLDEEASQGSNDILHRDEGGADEEASQGCYDILHRDERGINEEASQGYYDILHRDEGDVDEDASLGFNDILHQREYLKMVKIIKCKGANDESIDKLVKVLRAHVKTIEEVIVSDK